jgi:hypothetical protein
VRQRQRELLSGEEARPTFGHDVPDRHDASRNLVADTDVGLARAGVVVEVLEATRPVLAEIGRLLATLFQKAEERKRILV